MVVGYSQQRFMRGRSCLIYLISFYDKVTYLFDQMKSVYVIFLDFNKAFSSISHSILLNKMSSIWLDKSIMPWVSNWLMDQAQRIIENEATVNWWTVSSGIHHKSVLKPALFNVFMNDLDIELENILSKVAGETK